jgi:hypothetical protein
MKNNHKEWAKPFDLERAIKKPSSESIAYRASYSLKMTPREARKHLCNLYSWIDLHYKSGKIGSGSLHDKCCKELKEYKSAYNL